MPNQLTGVHFRRMLVLRENPCSHPFHFPYLYAGLKHFWNPIKLYSYLCFPRSGSKHRSSTDFAARYRMQYVPDVQPASSADNINMLYLFLTVLNLARDLIPFAFHTISTPFVASSQSLCVSTIAFRPCRRFSLCLSVK